MLTSECSWPLTARCGTHWQGVEATRLNPCRTWRRHILARTQALFNYTMSEHIGGFLGELVLTKSSFQENT